MLAVASPDGKYDLRLRTLLQLDVHVDVADVLRELASGALNGDEPRLDLYGDTLGDFELFGLEDVAHLQRESVSANLATAGGRRAKLGDLPRCIPGRPTNPSKTTVSLPPKR